MRSLDTAPPGLNRPCLFFLLIVLFNLIVYFPSLYHVARGDQVTYLAETAGKTDWGELSIRSYDLNRNRSFSPGDEWLFRPLFYAFLGTEKFFFGYNFISWQATGIILHILALWCLLKLLLCIQKSPAAYLLTAFFSVLTISSEMVIWHHINGYLIFIIFILLALKELYLFPEEEKKQPRRLAVITAFLLVASFTYEIANLYAVLFYFYIVSVSSKGPARKRASWLLAPPALYTILSAVNLFGINHFHPATFLKPVSSDFLMTAVDSFWIDLYWFGTGIFTNQLNFIQVSGQWSILPGKALTALGALTKLPLSFLLFATATAAIISYVFILKKNRFFSVPQKNRPFLLLITAMLFTYGLVIVLGRTGTGDMMESYLLRRPYYSYLAWLLFIILFYRLIDLKKYPLSALLKYSTAVCLMILTLINGALTYKANTAIARIHQDRYKLVKRIENLIKTHKKEAGFSFSVAADYPGNEVIPYLFKLNDPEKREYRFVEVLYPKYYRSENARYDLKIENEE